MALDTHAEERGRRTPKDRRKHLSLADRHEIRERFEGGESAASIAQDMGVNPTTVHRSVKRRVGV
jgi:IS30 family transposase